MNVLAFDCSTSSCSAAVLADDKVLAWRQVAMARGQAEVLLPMIVETLAEAGLTWAEINLIGVTVGPGTFTGLRIGLAAARGMALASGLPLAGVTTCEAVAHATSAAERQGRTLVVAVDGKRADLFIQPFNADLQPLAEADAVMPEAVGALVAGPFLLAGCGAARLAEALPEAVLSAACGAPDARVVARLAARRWAEGRALPPLPLYLRPPDVTLPSC